MEIGGVASYGIDISAPRINADSDKSDAAPAKRSEAGSPEKGDTIELDSGDSAEPLLGEEHAEAAESADAPDAPEAPESAEAEEPAEGAEEAEDAEAAEAEGRRVGELKGDPEREHDEEGEENEDESGTRKKKLASAVSRRRADGLLRKQRAVRKGSMHVHALAFTAIAHRLHQIAHAQQLSQRTHARPVKP